MLLYLVSVFDKKAGEYMPVGIYDNTKKIKEIFEGYMYSVVDYKLNKTDYKLIMDLEDMK